jgi:Spy/CpxP family protein refolding chaperone
MRRLFLALIVLGVAATLAGAAFCNAQEDYGRGHMMGSGCDWGSGNMMGQGHMMGPGYMGRGHMMDYGRRGCGMHGRGRPSLKPEDRGKWDKMRAAHLKDTLELRKKLATKQIELETLWAQPNVDTKKVEKLSDEVGELRRRLWTKRDQHQLQCRKQFGDQDWTCPGGW